MYLFYWFDFQSDGCYRVLEGHATQTGTNWMLPKLGARLTKVNRANKTLN